MLYITYQINFTLWDSSASSRLAESEVDQRVRLYLDMEDPDVVIDFRTLQSGHKTKYDDFWKEVDKFLVGLAVEERRQSEITHLAMVISVRDLLRRTSYNLVFTINTHTIMILVEFAILTQKCACTCSCTLHRPFQG